MKKIFIECGRNSRIFEFGKNKNKAVDERGIKKIFVVRIGNRNYAHKILLDKMAFAPN